MDICQTGKDEKGSVELKMKFQVAEVKKPLLAVCRMAEKGNKVMFGPEEGDNFIFNIKSGRKIPLKCNGRGSYLLEVLVNGVRTEITVDSGAEESVCPKEWCSMFPTKPCKLINFRGAGGKPVNISEKGTL